MNFEIEKADNYTIVKFQSHKLDSQISSSLREELKKLDAEGVKNIIFDLTNIRFCGSIGLALILITYRFCKTNDGKFILTGLQEQVKKTIAISQLDTILTITNYLPDALLEMLGIRPIHL